MAVSERERSPAGAIERDVRGRARAISERGSPEGAGARGTRPVREETPTKGRSPTTPSPGAW